MKIIRNLKKHVERWNKWRKHSYMSRWYKFLVLVGVKYSPTFTIVLTDAEEAEIQRNMEKAIFDNKWIPHKPLLLASDFDGDPLEWINRNPQLDKPKTLFITTARPPGGVFDPVLMMRQMEENQLYHSWMENQSIKRNDPRLKRIADFNWDRDNVYTRDDLKNGSDFEPDPDWFCKHMNKPEGEEENNNVKS